VQATPNPTVSLATMFLDAPVILIVDLIDIPSMRHFTT
jgi:hypothetical protein